MPSQLPDSSAESSGRSHLRVRHDTTYSYPVTASLAYNLAWLAPLNNDSQELLQHQITVNPKPQIERMQTDSFGNSVRYFEVHSPHSQLQVSSEATVTRRPRPRNRHCQLPWESLRFDALADTRLQVQFCAFAYPSPMVSFADEIRDYTLVSFTKQRPMAEALLSFANRIYADYDYDPFATKVETTLQEFCQLRKGVCQDFSHFAVSGLRSIGLVAAYVSGYVMTYPPEGQEKRPGSDASHAWVAVWVPDYGWLHVDPTNKMWVEDEHLIVALGRDYSDVPPLKGVCYGAGQQQPEVAVTMKTISSEELSHGH